MQYPTLSTSRIHSRFLTQADVPIWAKFFEAPEAIEFFPWVPDNTNEERARFWIEKQMARYRENRYGLQAIIDNNSGEFVGQCGLLLQDVNGVSELEIGYSMYRSQWGKGYAPAAAKMFLDFAIKSKLAPSVISIIDTHNVKSQRVAEKNGFVRDSETDWQGMHVFIYRYRIAG